MAIPASIGVTVPACSIVVVLILVAQIVTNLGAQFDLTSRIHYMFGSAPVVANIDSLQMRPSVSDAKMSITEARSKTVI
jgi:hypothetical protein